MSDRTRAPAPITIAAPDSAEEWEDYYRFRWRLLRAPWAQPPGSERDEFEADAHHLLARNGFGEIVAVGRVHFPTADEAQIRYMATGFEYRGRGIGSGILARLEQVAIDRGAKRIFLNARAGAVPFYERLGYTIQEPGPTLFGQIRHELMTKAL